MHVHQAREALLNAVLHRASNGISCFEVSLAHGQDLKLAW